MSMVIGPDVSFYQDLPETPQGIDFVKMRQKAGFVIIRAGQNLWVDPLFRTNWTNAKAAGMPRGSYWFYDSRAEPKRQAELYAQTLGNDLGELPLFADFEENYKGPYAGWRKWYEFLERLRQLVGGKEIGIYTAYYYWRSNAPSASLQPANLEYFRQYPLWIAHYGAASPSVPLPWKADEWLFWQFTEGGDGLAYGVESKGIDLNYFNGDFSAFQARFNLSGTEPPPSEPDNIDINGTKYKVNVNALNVRSGPGISFEKIGSIKLNDIVDGIEAVPEQTWIKVRVSETLTGWCFAQYLTQIEYTPPPPSTDEFETIELTGKYRVTTSSLTLRSGPGANYAQVSTLNLNDIVDAIRALKDGTWIQISSASNLTGWCLAQYLVQFDDTPPPPPSGEFETIDLTGKYKITASVLNVRSGPSINYDIVGKLRLNDIVDAIKALKDNTWIQVRNADSLVGWCFSEYLVEFTDEPTQLPESVIYWARVSASVLNVRKEAGTTFEVIGKLQQGDTIAVLSENSDKTWAQIRRVDGLKGWSSKQYLNNLGSQIPSEITQTLLNGLIYYRKEQTTPRKIVSHILRVDLMVAGLQFLVTPPLRDSGPPLCTMKTSKFLSRYNLQVAVNGDGFYYLNPETYSSLEYCPNGGDPLWPNGLAASRGKAYSKQKFGAPVIYIDAANKITFNQYKGSIFNALSGDRMLVDKGKVVSGLDNTRLDPRTAVGTNQSNRWLILAVVDGRETSAGMTFAELASLLRSFGVYTGMSLDGGGSSTMVIQGIDNQPVILNTPVDNNNAGQERAVANHLGIFVKK